MVDVPIEADNCYLIRLGGFNDDGGAITEEKLAEDDPERASALGNLAHLFRQQRRAVDLDHAQRRSGQRFINGPGYRCGDPRPW